MEMLSQLLVVVIGHDCDVVIEGNVDFPHLRKLDKVFWANQNGYYN